ncbi:hypothetical protein EMIT0P228_110029 [Pseudomonas brassicacearum]
MPRLTIAAGRAGETSALSITVAGDAATAERVGIWMGMAGLIGDRVVMTVRVEQSYAQCSEYTVRLKAWTLR